MTSASPRAEPLRPPGRHGCCGGCAGHRASTVASVLPGTRAAAPAAGRPRAAGRARRRRSRTSLIERSAARIDAVGPSACETGAEEVADELHDRRRAPGTSCRPRTASRRCAPRRPPAGRTSVTGAPRPQRPRAYRGGGARTRPTADAAGRRQRARQEVHLADEVGDEGGGRLAVDLVGRADLLDAALVHHHDPVGHRQRLLLVVGDHDRGEPEAALQRRGSPRAGARAPGRRAPTAARRAAAGRARVASARASATRCCWPPESWRRVLLRLVGEADQLEQFARRACRSRPASALPADEAVADVARRPSGWGTARRTGRRCRSRAADGGSARDVRPPWLIRPDGLRRRGRRWRAAASSCRSRTARGSRRTRPRSIVERDVLQRLERTELLGDVADPQIGLAAGARSRCRRSSIVGAPPSPMARGRPPPAASASSARTCES